ncbi:MAG TPA: L-aspartate oxidase [Armatimonadetes bacterium]|nr:L-aspartate oxidase [Armatimonadota bacterium]
MLTIRRYLISQREYRARHTEVRHYDAIVLGSGVAGLWTALHLSWLGELRVAIVTKSAAHESNTHYAQGGIAAVLCPKDSPEQHFLDTVEAGAGLCNDDAVWVLVTETPSCVLKLRELGAQFDEEDGRLLLGREGAHGIRRIVHAWGDRTGYEVERTLLNQVRRTRVDLFENAFAVDLLTHGDECYGVLAWLEEERKFIALTASATFLCTGGAGQLYDATTNPPVTTGDGIAIAFRAGAQLMDLEFVQFHPTALVEPQSPRLLISEAVRGEGAVLTNVRGERFMPWYHPDADLAARDVVCRAIFKEMERTGSDYVMLDMTKLGREFIQTRFPHIYEQCLERGYDITAKPIPVAPAAHYMMGGVRTDLHGRTSIKRLFAIGEVACSGLHGANRLASNSLNEALVFGQRAVHASQQWLKNRIASVDPCELLPEEAGPSKDHDWHDIRDELQHLMSANVGIVRSQQRLETMRAQLEQWLANLQSPSGTPVAWELMNMLLLSCLIVESALQREESRGAHYREDFPQRDDAQWRVRLIHQPIFCDGHICIPAPLARERVVDVGTDELKLVWTAAMGK